MWDIAAGLIINEAGGIIDNIDLSNNNNLKVVASNPNINEKLKEKLVNFLIVLGILCYKSRHEKNTSKLPQHKSWDDRWITV